MGDALRIENLTFTYAGADAPSLRDVSLRVASGQLVVLAGASGCGKTTLTRVISGLIPAFFEGELTGSATVGALNVIEAESWDTARQVGTVFQNPRTQFFTTDTASELAFGCENLGLPPDETRRRVADAVAAHNLAGLMDRSVFALSGGEKQRLACGAVAAMETPVLVLDEPSANLDARSVGELHAAIAHWLALGRTLIVAEHRLSYLRELVDAVFIMEDGRIISRLTGDQFRSLDKPACNEMGLRSPVPVPLPKQRTGDAASAELELSDVLVRRRRPAVPGRPLVKGRVTTLDIERCGFNAGAVTAVVGQNGAGKTTLANVLAGLGPRQRGVMTLEGVPISWRQRWSRCYLVQQDVSHQLFTESAEREVMLACPHGTADPQAMAAEALAQVNLTAFSTRHPLSLSAGQRQRLAIACALASGRPVAVFDEPTSGLDLHQMQAIAVALRRLADQGRVVLVITHDAELITAVADEVVELVHGRVAGTNAHLVKTGR